MGRSLPCATQCQGVYFYQMSSTPRQKSLSQFTLEEALERLELDVLTSWQPEFAEKAPSAYFTENLRRLDAFDLLRSEGAKTLLCVVEAKKDNFEKGLAQCLIELHACAENNRAAGREYAVYGIVTNSQGWQFYRLETSGEVFETGLFSSTNTAQLLGMLDGLFAHCTEQLEETTR